MAIRKADARWTGDLKSGKGTVALGSGAYEGQYSFSSRFEEGTGTNPEELIGAAHAGCFTMYLSGQLTEAGHPPESLDTTAEVSLEVGDSGPSIPRIKLTTRARVPGIDEAGFEKAVENSKRDCPVSKALAGVPDIEVDATLEG